MAFAHIQVLLATRDAAHTGCLAQALMQVGATVSLVNADSIERVLEEIAARNPSMLVLELDASCADLEQIRARFAALPIVVISARPSPELAFAVSRLGVEDLLVLPLEDSLMQARLLAAVEHVSLRPPDPEPSSLIPENPELVPAFGNGSSYPLVRPPVLVGANPQMAEIRETVEKVAGTDVTVLIRGESGVGKEIVARLLFERSRRRQKPFVKVNCAAIPHDLLESELFGYEAGAFTGAVRAKPGKFELADHGTLFLDEIAEMHPMLQAKLLHVLQDGSFSRLGAKRDVSVDVRVLCATNKSLIERVSQGLFREDLLYRINVVTIQVPPLRERRDEIPILADYFLRKYAQQYGRELRAFSPEVLANMEHHQWPGNVRELENLCKRFVIVGSQTQILRELAGHKRAQVVPALDAASGAADDRPLQREGSHATPDASGLRDENGHHATSLSLLEIGRRAAWQAERKAILDMLEQTRWNRRESARRLQVSYKALLNKIKQMHLEAQKDESQSSTQRNPVTK